MSAEFYIIFENIDWYYSNKDKIKQKIMSLDTFIYHTNDEFWLKEDKQFNDLYFDIRLFLDDEYILLEITMHPANIEKDLKEFCNWLRLNTIIKIQDEDFNISNW